MKKDISKYAPVIARLGVGIVFFIFGIWQLSNPSSWFGYIPDFILNAGIFPGYVIFFNGILDFLIGFALLTGFFLRPAAALGILHLIITTTTLGFNDVSVRDFGLLVVLISVFLHGPDYFCLGKRYK